MTYCQLNYSNVSRIQFGLLKIAIDVHKDILSKYNPIRMILIEL